jgi:hypothetical protein
LPLEEHLEVEESSAFGKGEITGLKFVTGAKEISEDRN